MKSILNLYAPIGIVCVFLSACGAGQSPQTQTSTDAIVGGSTVEKRDQMTKSIVAIVSERNQRQALCTGTLLGKDIVLTAAHCVEGSPQKLMIVFSLNVDQADSSDVRIADAYVQNDHWHQPTSDGRGDLALIHFQGGVPNGFAAAKLAPKSFKIEKGMTVLFAGFGVTNGKREGGAGQLRGTETTVVGDFSPTEVVTDGKKRGVCFGDSGGPAFILRDSKIIQWGVASSVTNHSCNDLSIHTSIMNYRSWISEKIRELRGHED